MKENFEMNAKKDDSANVGATVNAKKEGVVVVVNELKVIPELDTTIKNSNEKFAVVPISGFYSNSKLDDKYFVLIQNGQVLCARYKLMGYFDDYNITPKAKAVLGKQPETRACAKNIKGTSRKYLIIGFESSNYQQPYYLDPKNYRVISNGKSLADCMNNPSSIQYVEEI